MRWLLLKDLQILRRSPLLVGLLIAYAAVVAMLVAFATSAGPSKPKVAFVNLVPSEKNEFSIGGETRDVSGYAAELFKAIDPVKVESRAKAIEMVRSGKVLGALILPEDATDRLQSTINLSGGELPTVEVFYNADDPVKQRYVESSIEARLSDANKALSESLTEIAAEYIDIIVSGGQFSILGRSFSVLGLKKSETILRATIASLPKDEPGRVALEQVARFAKLASDNLDISKPILTSIGSPVRVKQTVVKGRKTSIDAYGVVVALTISLMFVTLLIGSGMLALEREENSFGRLVRGLVSKTGLLAEKVGLAALCAVAVALAMIGLLAFFVDIDWGRAPLWLAAIAFAATAFAALGVAVGGLAREVRAASLLAFVISLPIAVLGLIPTGVVGEEMYDVVQAVSAAFPFRPAVQALNAGLNDAEPALGGPLLHLAALTVAFGALARLAVRRFT